MGFKLGILGLGTVGCGTVKLLLDSDGRHPLLEEIEIYRVGVRSLDKPRDVELPQRGYNYRFRGNCQRPGDRYCCRTYGWIRASQRVDA